MSSSKHITFQTFSGALRKALNIRNLSNREFADLMGKDEGQVSHWTTGRHKPYKTSQDEICKVLQVEINELEDGWNLVDKKESTKHADERLPIDDSWDRLTDHVAEQGISYKDRDQIIAILQDRANNLAKDLRSFSLLIEQLKDMQRSSDDS